MADVEPRRTTGPRPRDALGRPLPHGTPGVPPLADDTALPPALALVEAQRLLDAGLLFQAHEVFEAVWKAAPEPQRDLWRGLAQLAVGLTHLARGNATGGSRLLRRGAANLDTYRGSGTAGDLGVDTAEAVEVDVDRLCDWATSLAANIDEQQRTDPAVPPRYTVPRVSGRLRPGARSRSPSHKVEE